MSNIGTPMKILIIPGFAKSGTTFLYDQLRHLGDKINMPVRKEIDYFRRGDNWDEYMKCFETHDPDKVFLDASPQYSTADETVIKNAKTALKGHDVKILFGLRDPLSRAYSHYLHDLSAMFWIFALSGNDFLHPDVLAKYFIPQKKIVDSFVTGFGEENVSGFGFKVSGKKLPADINSFLGLPKSYRLDTDTNPAPGSLLPKVYYNAEKPIPVISEGEFYILPPKCLLIVSGQWSQLRANFPPDLANQILTNVGKWCWRFDPSHLGAQADKLRTDYLECFDLLGMKRETLSPPVTITAKVPGGIDDQTLSQMTRWGSMQDALEMDFDAEKRDQYARALPAFMHKVTDATMRKDNAAQTRWMETALSEFGPLPNYVTGYIRNLMVANTPQVAIDYLKANPGVDSICQLGALHNAFNHFGKKFKKDEYLELGELLGVSGLKWVEPETAKPNTPPATKPAHPTDKALEKAVLGKPIQIFSHDQCASDFTETYLKQFCEENKFRFDYEARSSEKKAKDEKGVLKYHANADYKSAVNQGGKGLHIIRNPLDIVVSTFLEHTQSDPEKMDKTLRAHRNALDKMSKEDAVWATIKFLERRATTKRGGGPLLALKQWDFNNTDFYTVRCEDFLKFPRRCLIKNWSLLHSRAIDFKHFYQYPSAAFAETALSTTETVVATNYKKYLNDEQIKAICEAHADIIEEFYPRSAPDFK